MNRLRWLRLLAMVPTLGCGATTEPTEAAPGGTCMLTNLSYASLTCAAGETCTVEGSGTLTAPICAPRQTDDVACGTIACRYCGCDSTKPNTCLCSGGAFGPLPPPDLV